MFGTSCVYYTPLFDFGQKFHPWVQFLDCNWMRHFLFKFQCLFLHFLQNSLFLIASSLPSFCDFFQIISFIDINWNICITFRKCSSIFPSDLYLNPPFIYRWSTSLELSATIAQRRCAMLYKLHTVEESINWSVENRRWNGDRIWQI